MCRFSPKVCQILGNSLHRSLSVLSNSRTVAQFDTLKQPKEVRKHERTKDNKKGSKRALTERKGKQLEGKRVKERERERICGLTLQI